MARRRKLKRARMEWEPQFGEGRIEFAPDPQVKLRAWRNRDGQEHRKHGPAKEYEDGSKEWYQRGLMHRIDGPAQEQVSDALDSVAYYYAGAVVVPSRKAYIRMAQMSDEMQEHPAYNRANFDLVEVSG